MGNIETDDRNLSFLNKGIESSALERDKQLFEEISAIIYEFVTKGGHDYRPKKYEFRASSMGTCSRKILLDKHLNSYLSTQDIINLPIWYKSKRLEKETDSSKIEFGAHVTGQVIHEVIQTALKGRIHSIEQEIIQDFGNSKLIGHYDILMEYKDGENIVIDIKSTISKREFLPSFKHLKQLMAYQGMMGGIKGAILYVNRNTFELSFIPQEFNKEQYSELAKKVANLSMHEGNDTLPPAIPEFDYECQNFNFKCQFFSYCFGDIPSDDVQNSG